MGKKGDLDKVVVLQLLSCVQLFATPQTVAGQVPLSSTISSSLLKFTSTESVDSYSVSPFSFYLQSFPESGSFPMSWLFLSGGQCIGASASVFPMNIQGWFSLGLTSLISLQSKGLKSLLQHHNSKASVFWCLVFLRIQLSHHYLISFFLPLLFFSSLFPFLLASIPSLFPPSFPSFISHLVSSSVVGIQSRIRSSDTQEHILCPGRSSSSKQTWLDVSWTIKILNHFTTYECIWQNWFSCCLTKHI